MLSVYVMPACMSTVYMSCVCGPVFTWPSMAYIKEPVALLEEGKNSDRKKEKKHRVGREGKPSVCGRCCRGVQKEIEEERDRMWEKEGGGEMGFGWGRKEGVEVWRGFLLVAFSPD